MKIEESVFNELTEDQQWYITIFCRVLDEFVNEQIITPTQSNQMKDYILKKMLKKHEVQ
jgi:hypothetical protein